MSLRPSLPVLCGASLCLLVAVVAFPKHGPAPQPAVGDGATPPPASGDVPSPAQEQGIGESRSSLSGDEGQSRSALVAAAPGQPPPAPGSELPASAPADTGPHSREAAAWLAIRARAEQDPAGAVALLADLPGLPPTDLAAAVASAWGKQDPEAAAAWARAQPEGGARDEALFSLSADWAATNPAAAADCALASLPEALQGQMLNVVGMQWGGQDPATALAWAGQQPAGPARDSFLAGLSSTLAETSATQAAALVASLPPGKLQEETAITVVLDWARQQPQAAAEWVKLFPAGPLRQTALDNLVSLWAEPTPPPSPCPLPDWPEGSERDHAIRHFLDQVLDVEPGRAVELLPAISDPALREEETERLAQHWLAQDPQAARQWLVQASISDGTKARLYATHPPPP
jgi:hypothetical protein